jgi:4'-phosphopantetheinyl transferase
VIVIAGTPQAGLSRYGEATAALNIDERNRLRALADARDRDAFLAAHVLARATGARCLGVAAAAVNVVQRCATCGGPHGRPQVDGAPHIGLSLSHTRTYVAAAAGLGPVGVDVELTSRFDLDDDALLKAILTRYEVAAVEGAPSAVTALARLWVVKECLVKLGLATLDEFAVLDVADALPNRGDAHATTLRRWRDLHLLQWDCGDTGSVGAALSEQPLMLERVR